MTTCIGCGCDDHNACRNDDLAAGCHWLALDTKTGFGVCSACPELLKRWRDGYRDPLPEFIELRVIELLEDIYEPDEALRWFRSPQKLLEGKQPHELVARGDVRRVREVIDEILDGVYL